MISLQDIHSLRRLGLALIVLGIAYLQNRANQGKQNRAFYVFRMLVLVAMSGSFGSDMTATATRLLPSSGQFRARLSS